MKVEQYDGVEERHIITGMIVDKTVLGQISAKWGKKGLFKSKWCNLIGRWCVDYYQRYDAAPGGVIESIFEAWAGDGQDEDTMKLVEKFLSGISDEYESRKQTVNSQYTIDLASKYFYKVQSEKLIEEIRGDIEVNSLDKIEKRINAFGKVELGAGVGIDVLRDMEAIKTTFAEKGEPLIHYRGPLGQFFSVEDALERDSFLGVLAPEKKGKTFWLQDFACRGLFQRKKVAFFQVGDLSQNQMMRRFMVRFAKRPLKPKTIKIPYKIRWNPEVSKNSAFVKHNDITYKDPLDWQDAWQACKRILESRIKSEETYLKLVCYPTFGINVNGIKSTIQSWERQGWIPDIVVIDYADNLGPPSSGTEGRDAINETWGRLRGLSQEFHCLVVTATQSNAASYKADILDMTNFANDKRKFAHVTAMVGLNANEEEKEKGVIRVNYVVLREDEFIGGRCVHVAGCLSIANPAIKSTF